MCSSDLAFEPSIVAQGDGGLWAYAHQRRFDLPGGFSVYGYAFVPPTPFLLKDWERYDVSRYVDPGCVSPEEGRRTEDVPLNEIRNATILYDLERLEGEKAQDGADLGHRIEGSHQMHLGGAGVREAHFRPCGCQGTHQGFGAVHAHLLVRFSAAASPQPPSRPASRPPPFDPDIA